MYKIIVEKINLYYKKFISSLSHMFIDVNEINKTISE